MTVRELTRLLQTYPPDTQVWMEADAGLRRVGGVEREVSGPDLGGEAVRIYPQAKDL